MTLKHALHVLMVAAQNDIRGGGQGYRSTSEEWRDEVSEAWTKVFKHLYKRWPDPNEFYNAGIKNLRNTKKANT